jgi:hypothetical protein
MESEVEWKYLCFEWKESGFKGKELGFAGKYYTVQRWYTKIAGVTMYYGMSRLLY